MINRIVLVGRMVKDPELKFGQSGTGICNFTLAVDRAFKKDGQPDADFPRVIQFGKGGEATANFMSKGSLVAVDGRLQTRTWESDNGRQYATEVIADSVKFLDSKPKQEQQQKSFESEGTQVDDSEGLPF